MQFNHAPAILKERGVPATWTVVRFSILIVCLVFILARLNQEELQLIKVLTHLQRLTYPEMAGLGILILLAPLNWSIEACKWYYLTRHFDGSSFQNAFKSVLMGLSFGFITPRAIGDYFGRVMYMKRDNRISAISPAMISRISQLIPTIVFGSFGVLYYTAYFNIQVIIKWWMFASLLILIIAFVVFRLVRWEKVLRNRKLPSGFRLLLEPMSYLNGRDLIVAGGMSIGRYLIFTSQFILALWIFSVPAGIFVLFAGVTWILLMKSILPSFNFLSDLGVREFSAVIFFESLGYPILPVLLASLFVWLVNILLPSILGLTFFSKVRI